MALRCRKYATAALVAIMIASAGCVGGIINGNDTPSTEAGTDIQSESTPTPPTGEDLNTTEALSDTRSWLESAESYSMDSNSRSTTHFPESAQQIEGTQVIATNATLQVDSETNRSLNNATVSGTSPTGSSGESTTANYVNGSVSYSRWTNETQPEYLAVDYENQSVSASSFSTPGQSTSALSLLTAFDNWNEQELTTIHGVTVRRFTASGVDSQPSIAGEMTNASAEFYIDSEGIIRSVEMNYTQEYSSSGITVEHELQRTMYDVNSTSVEEPGWVAEAPDPVPVSELQASNETAPPA